MQTHFGKKTTAESHFMRCLPSSCIILSQQWYQVAEEETSGTQLRQRSAGGIKNLSMKWGDVFQTVRN